MAQIKVSTEWDLQSSTFFHLDKTWSHGLKNTGNQVILIQERYKRLIYIHWFWDEHFYMERGEDGNGKDREREKDRLVTAEELSLGNL